jgi:hypothetical protein
MTTRNIAPGDSFYRPNGVIIRNWTDSDAATAEVKALIAASSGPPV